MFLALLHGTKISSEGFVASATDYYWEQAAASSSHGSTEGFSQPAFNNANIYIPKLNVYCLFQLLVAIPIPWNRPRICVGNAAVSNGARVSG